MAIMMVVNDGGVGVKVVVWSKKKRTMAVCEKVRLNDHNGGGS